MMLERSVEELEQRARALGPWFHNINLGGVQNFLFNGTTAAANRIWYTESGGNTTLHFDTDSNTANDEMTIVLIGTGLGLTSADFIL